MSKMMRLIFGLAGACWAAGMAQAQDMASPPNSLVVDETGKVGVGTAAPSTPLHVVGDEDAMLMVENTSTTKAARVMFKLKNNGKVRFAITNGNKTWTFDNAGSNFQISRVGTGKAEFKFFETGNMEILGALTENSSRASKRDINEVDAQAVLAKVLTLPISEWSYQRDASVRHLGPMAEDFRAAFGLGNNGTGIATLDTSGVALAAIQGLKADQDARIDALTAENRSFKAELAELKRLIQRLVAQDKVAITR